METVMDDETRSYLAGMMAQIDLHFERVMEKLSTFRATDTEDTKPAPNGDDRLQLETELAALRSRTDMRETQDRMLSELMPQFLRLLQRFHTAEVRIQVMEDRIRLESAPHRLFSLWVVLELWLGVLACLAFSAFLAIGAPGGFVNVLGGLVSFALCGLVFAPVAAVAIGLNRIGVHAVAWQLGWITFVLVATWLGHVVIGLIPAFQKMPSMIW
jgi:hypothetical protein